MRHTYTSKKEKAEEENLVTEILLNTTIPTPTPTSTQNSNDTTPSTQVIPIHIHSHYTINYKINYLLMS